MRGRPGLRVAALAGATLLLGLLAVAVTATNTVPASRAGVRTFAITAQSLAPPQCAGMGLTNVIVNGSGTAGNDLLLGTPGDDVLLGRGGRDCLIAGGTGNNGNTLNGGLGVDVCIGDQANPGGDTFRACETIY